MRYELRVTAYDVMDNVSVTGYLVATSDTPGTPPQVVWNRSTTVTGTGESDPSRWSTDALVALLETL